MLTINAPAQGRRTQHEPEDLVEGQGWHWPWHLQKGKRTSSTRNSLAKPEPRGLTGLSVSAWAAVTKLHTLYGLNNRSLFLIVLEARIRDSDLARFGFWWEPASWPARRLSSHRVLACQRERVSLGSSPSAKSWCQRQELHRQSRRKHTPVTLTPGWEQLAKRAPTALAFVLVTWHSPGPC